LTLALAQGKNLVPVLAVEGELTLMLAFGIQPQTHSLVQGREKKKSSCEVSVSTSWASSLLMVHGSLLIANHEPSKQLNAAWY
jgi:hypothetical protein